MEENNRTYGESRHAETDGRESYAAAGRTGRIPRQQGDPRYAQQYGQAAQYGEQQYAQDPRYVQQYGQAPQYGEQQYAQDPRYTQQYGASHQYTPSYGGYGTAQAGYPQQRRADTVETQGYTGSYRRPAQSAPRAD